MQNPTHPADRETAEAAYRRALARYQKCLAQLKVAKAAKDGFPPLPRKPYSPQARLRGPAVVARDAEICRRSRAGESIQALAAAYGMATSTIYRITRPMLAEPNYDPEARQMVIEHMRQNYRGAVAHGLAYLDGKFPEQS